MSPAEELFKAAGKIGINYRTLRRPNGAGRMSPVLGDAMYPYLLAEAERHGHVTEDERTDAYALHKRIETTR